MKVDALAIELRPRPMGEAADLGMRLVQAHAGSVWRTCAPVFLAVALLALCTVSIANWLPMLVIFWLKPWIDRSILFVLSRAVFGQPTRFSDLWRAQRAVWWQGFGRSLLVRRFSPWRAFTQAIEQLEGQQGAARRSRGALLLAGQRGAACGLQTACVHIELILVMGVLLLIAMFAPQGSSGTFLEWLVNSDSLAATLLEAGVYAAVVFTLEPLFVGAGFAMYLNRRVQLESWDIEQEFRRAFA
jgi:hypothetical protein